MKRSEEENFAKFHGHFRIQKQIRQRGSRKADLETDGIRRRKLKSGN